MAIPDPALVWLVGPSGSGKSTWAGERFAPNEVVSSDALRAMLGSDPSDLDVSESAFDVLRQIALSRIGRRLTTVIDTLGFDSSLRGVLFDAAEKAGVPVVAVVFRTGKATVRTRNASRNRPVPARVLDSQFARAASVTEDLEASSVDVVVIAEGEVADGAAERDHRVGEREPGGLEVFLHLSDFTWVEDWRRDLALLAGEAERAGFAGVSVLDHLVQIPQAGRAWDPMPEALMTLGGLAAGSEELRLCPLVLNVTLRHPVMLARSLAVLDAWSGGRVEVGLGAGWRREPQLDRSIPFPDLSARFEALEETIDILRAMWAPGSKARRVGRWVLEDTSSYPRPVQDRIPIVVGGRSQRAMAIALAAADEWNLSTPDPQVVEAAARRLSESPDADPGRRVRLSVLDPSLVARDRGELVDLVERHRGMVAASSFRSRTRAGTVEAHLDRLEGLRALGVDRVYLAPVGMDGVETVRRVAPLVEALTAPP